MNPSYNKVNCGFGGEAKITYSSEAVLYYRDNGVGRECKLGTIQTWVRCGADNERTTVYPSSSQ